MSVDLAQIDNDVRIQERLWNLHSTYPENNYIDMSLNDAYMIVLAKEYMGGSARAFDTIDCTESQSGLRAALLQYMLRAVELVVSEHTKSAQEGKNRLPYPFVGIYLETVVESDAAARSHEPSKDENVRETIIRNMYDIDINDIESDSAADANKFECEFMKDCRNRLVVEYRLWIFVNTHINFAKKLEEVMKLAMAEHAKRTSATTLSADNKSLREFQKTTGETPSSTTNFNIARVLKTDERWALLNSPDVMLDAIAAYTNNLSFLHTQTRAVALSAVNTLGDARNPAYLGAVFSARMQFCIADLRIDESQRTWANYSHESLPAPQGTKSTSSTQRYFKFPHCNRVLVVPTDSHNRRFIYRYTPEYMLLNFQNRLMHENFIKAQHSIANAIRGAVNVPAQVQTNDDDFVGGGSDNFVRPKKNSSKEVPTTSATTSSMSLDEQNRRLVDKELENSEVRTRLTRGEQRTTAEQAAVDALILKSTYVDPVVHEQRKKLALAQSGNVRRNTMDQIAAEYRDLFDERISAAKTDQERCIAYTKLQISALRDYIAACTNPLADVSQRGKIINQYFSDLTLHHRNAFVPIKFFDPALSVFGHMVVREMHVLDEIYHLHSSHQLNLSFQVSLMNAYQRKHSLHYNNLTLGPPEEGKSNALEVLERRAIPGTLDVQSRYTAQAHSVDESNNDVCEGIHEAPAMWLIDPNQMPSNGKSNNNDNKNSAAHDEFKGRLTSMVVRTREPRKMADGTQRIYVRISEQIMTYILLANLDERLIAAAILSRFYVTVVAEVNRKDITMAAKMLNEANESRRLVERRHLENRQFRLMQVLFAHIEKQFYFRSLTEPSLTVFSLLLPIFGRVMEEHGIRIRPRSVTKMRLFIHHWVIRRAIFMAYQAPTAPFMKDVNLTQLARLDPWLYDDQEIVFFAFRFMQSQYINPRIVIVSKALRVYLETRCARPRVFARANESSDVRWRKRVPTSSQAKLSDYVPDAEAEKLSKHINKCEWSTATASDQAFDWNRITLYTRHETLAVELEGIISKTESVRLTRAQIECCLSLMTTKSLYDYEYVPNNAFGGKITNSDFPVVPNTSQPKKTNVALLVDNARGTMSLHVSVIRLLTSDPMTAVIAACSDSNIQDTKMLSGSLVAENLPHLFATFKPTANPNVLHYTQCDTSLTATSSALTGSLDVDDNDADDAYLPTKQAEGTVINMSLDEYSGRRRMRDIFLPESAWVIFSFRHIEEKIRSDPANFVAKEQQLDYPDEAKVVVSQTERSDEIQTLLSSYSREDAKLYLEGRVAFLQSSTTSEVEKNALKALFEEFGYDVDSVKSLAERWDQKRDANDAKLSERQALDRAEVTKTRKELISKIDATLTKKRAKSSQNNMAVDDGQF